MNFNLLFLKLRFSMIHWEFQVWIVRSNEAYNAVRIYHLNEKLSVFTPANQLELYSHIEVSIWDHK